MTTAQFQQYQQASNAGTISDDQNPIFIFQGASTEVLVQFLAGKISLEEMAKIELANRGYDVNGKWVFFKKK